MNRMRGQDLIIVTARPDHRSVIQDEPYFPLAFCVGFLFSGRTIFVLITGRWLNVGTEPGLLTGFGLAGGLCLMAALGTFGARLPLGGSAWSCRSMRWVLLYLAFSGCSLFWTASASVASSALYWLSLAGDVGIVVLIVRRAGRDKAMDSLLKGFIAGSCALAVIAWLMPVAADLRLGDLEYFNTNQIGNLCALSVLMCSLLSVRGDAVWPVVPWFLSITLVRTLSKATLAAFVVCLLYRFIRDKSVRRGSRWLSWIAAIVLALTFWGLFSSYYDVYTTAGNQAETLTGRTAIWAWALDAALRRPWFGNGFDSMWKVAPPFGGDLFEARHAENELLQQFFAYGLCGVVLLIGIYGSLYREVRTLPSGPERIALTAFLVYVAVRGLAEAEPFDLLLPLWLITAFALRMREYDRPKSMLQIEPESSTGMDALPAC
jgi:exopolysaccharide production protein ExoQ